MFILHGNPASTVSYRMDRPMIVNVRDLYSSSYRTRSVFQTMIEPTLTTLTVHSTCSSLLTTNGSHQWKRYVRQRAHQKLRGKIIHADPTQTDFKVDVADFGAIKTPEWLSHQPFGQMPWLEDTETGIEVYESRAIAKCMSTITHTRTYLTLLY